MRSRSIGMKYSTPWISVICGRGNCGGRGGSGGVKTLRPRRRRSPTLVGNRWRLEGAGNLNPRLDRAENGPVDLILIGDGATEMKKQRARPAGSGGLAQTARRVSAHHRVTCHQSRGHPEEGYVISTGSNYPAGYSQKSVIA